jgi:hypothetical protein
MRRQAVTRETGLGRARRKGPVDDSTPGGSITGQPVQVQLSCQVFVCVRLQFQWAVPGVANITSIAPPPTNAERRKIHTGLFGPVAMAPVDLPDALDVQPCIFNCQCGGIRWGPWTPNPVPLTVTKTVDLLQAGQPPKTFTVTLSIPAKLRQGIGRCQ